VNAKKGPCAKRGSPSSRVRLAHRPWAAREAAAAHRRRDVRGEMDGRERQFTFTWIDFGFASGFFGRWTVRTPFFDSARIFSASTVPGSENERVNVP
jgi:hypothetical protein